MTISVNAHDDFNGESIIMSTEEETWPEVTDLFFRFMQAKGFIVTERDMSEYFAEKAEDMGDLRSNAESSSPDKDILSDWRHCRDYCS